MNQKEYELIAEVLRDVMQFAEIQTAHKKYNNGKYDTWYMTVSKLSGAMAQTYSNFDRTKFLTACGLEKGEDEQAAN